MMAATTYSLFGEHAIAHGVTAKTSTVDWGTVGPQEREAQFRVSSALDTIGFKGPITGVMCHRTITPACDLAAFASACSSRGISAHWIDAINAGRVAFAGMLSHDGRVLTVRGITRIARQCRLMNQMLIIPEGNRMEAAIVPGVRAYAFSHVKQLGEVLRGIVDIEEFRVKGHPLVPKPCALSVEDLDRKVPVAAIKKLVLAGVPVLLIGHGDRPLSIARHVPSMFHLLSEQEMLEINGAFSAAGYTSHLPIEVRPFRAPHYTVSARGMFGDTNQGHPGEVGLATKGVLYLQEVSLFSDEVLHRLVEVRRKPAAIVMGSRPESLSDQRLERIRHMFGAVTIHVTDNSHPPR
jgi:magnesium chelatase family protein